MNNSKRILVVDDEPFNREIMTEFLCDEFSLVEIAVSGEECLNICRKALPDIILLDVNMPGLDGYQTCLKLKDIDDENQTSVIFVSAHGQAEDRIEGYKAGAVDYLVKPFEPEELLQKINRTLAYQDDVSDLRSSVASSNKVAFSAMTVSSELGEIIRIMEEMFLVTSYKELSAKYFEWSQSMELSSCIRIKTDNFELCLANNVSSTPIERELMELLASKERIFSFDSRTQFNAASVQILVKNMPKDDEVKYGRLIDTLPVILTGIDKCITRIYELNLKEQQQKHIQETIAEIRSISNHTSRTFEEMQKDILTVFNEFQSSLDWEIPRMGLEDDQEKLIMKLAEDCLGKSHKATDIGCGIKADLDKIILLLQDIS